MISFWMSMGPAYVAVTLLTSGVGHLVRFGSFRDLVRTHGIVPARLAPVAALVTVLAEVGFGTAALVLVPQEPRSGTHAVIFAGPAVLGLVFAGYVRRLLRGRDHTTSCGCSPLAGPLTPAALLPGAALAVVSATTLVAATLGVAPAGDPLPGALRVLPGLWGATLAVVVMLVPALMPRGAVDRSG